VEEVEFQVERVGQAMGRIHAHYQSAIAELCELQPAGRRDTGLAHAAFAAKEENPHSSSVWWDRQFCLWAASVYGFLAKRSQFGVVRAGIGGILRNESLDRHGAVTQGSENWRGAGRLRVFRIKSSVVNRLALSWRLRRAVIFGRSQFLGVRADVCGFCGTKVLTAKRGHPRR